MFGRDELHFANRTTPVRFDARPTLVDGKLGVELVFRDGYRLEGDPSAKRAVFLCERDLDMRHLARVLTAVLDEIQKCGPQFPHHFLFGEDAGADDRTRACAFCGIREDAVKESK